jgi:hypothetical protein
MFAILKEFLMIKKVFLPCSIIFLATLASQGQTTNKLHFPAAGFSIAPLEESPGEATQQVLLMFLPATNGFSANVNVQIQLYTGTIDGYRALSLQQFNTAGFKVLEQKMLGKSEVKFEYAGVSQGFKLHWYARAKKSGNKVYLVTATASDEQWSAVAARLKTCVDSFRCDSGE